MLGLMILMYENNKQQRKKDVEWCARLQSKVSQGHAAPFNIGRSHLLEQGVDPDYDGD